MQDFLSHYDARLFRIKFVHNTFQFILVERILKSNASRYSRFILSKTRSIWEYELLKTSWYPQVSRCSSIITMGAVSTVPRSRSYFFLLRVLFLVSLKLSFSSRSMIPDVHQHRALCKIILSHLITKDHRKSFYSNKSRLTSFHSISLINSFAYNDIFVCTTCVTYLSINISLG